MKHKYALFPLITGAIFLLGFLWMYISMWDDITPLWGQGLILAVPGLILCLIGYKAYKGTWSNVKTHIWTGILIPVMIWFFILCFLFLAFVQGEGTRDLRDYPKVYDLVMEEYDVKAVFPEEIPEDAEDIQFYYTPLLLQQGENFHLSYITTQEELSYWTEILEQEAQWIGPNTEWERTNRNLSVIGKDSEGIRYHLYWDGKDRGEMSYVLINPYTSRITFHWSFAE